MKTAGLIAEYNPFHTGHSYHIRKTKELTGADTVLAVMSGDFVQRGAPALMPKHLRTACALRSGVSAVIELPVYYACASAEYFALGAVSLLDSLGCVDVLCFGSECGDIRVLEEIADILDKEPEEYKTALRKGLKDGLSFPAARGQALKRYEAILSEPNNILGIEYLKALKRLNSPVKAYTVRRAGAGYHDTATGRTFCSASAIRANIGMAHQILDYIPENCRSMFLEAKGSRFPVESNDFSLLLKAKLLQETKDTLTGYLDVSRELASRIINYRNDFQSLEQFTTLLKTKELTYSRISRALFHILLGITGHGMEESLAAGSVSYARLLGFRENSAFLLKQIKEQSRIPLITKLPKEDTMNPAGSIMLQADTYAADLYESVVTEKFHTPFLNERQQSVVKL